MAAWNSFSYICTRALQSFLSFAHCRAATIVIPLLPKVTFTPSIQPNLGLPRTRPPIISAINTLPALLRTSSFLSLPIRDTPTNILKHFISRTFTFLLSAILITHACLCSVQRCWYNYSFIYSSYLLSPILYCSEHFSAFPTNTPHSFILCTTSISHPPSAAICRLESHEFDPHFHTSGTS